jgi:CRP-like cAMP-binding protein
MKFSGTSDGDARGLVTPLTRIQMVVHLQAVELFTYCTAEQMVRIASIARQKNFRAGEEIYAANDPAETMFCIAAGAVALVRADGGERRLGPKEIFGVEEILSDRLRGESAWARDDTVTLAVDAEDFFELLSNNIEIVKALFRQLQRQPATAPASAPAPVEVER